MDRHLPTRLLQLVTYIFGFAHLLVSMGCDASRTDVMPGRTGGGLTDGGNPMVSGGNFALTGGTLPSKGGALPSKGGALPSSGGMLPSFGGTIQRSGGSGPATGGNSMGQGGAAVGGVSGGCEAGTSTTVWATQCPSSPMACTQGTWVAGGPDSEHASFKLVAESDHFAVYSDENITVTTAQAATQYLENTVWKTYFGDPIYFKEPYCNSATKYKASIHVHSNWGLTGGAYGQGRMGMWIGTGALADHWGLAHEFTHAIQSVSGGMACSGRNTCGWIYESHANFMPHQLQEYRSNVHCSELSVNATHLYLGSTRVRYCNWQFMEFLKDKYCYSAVNAIWTSSPSSDPFTAIQKAQGWTMVQLNDFMGDWALHNITWDYQNPPPTQGGNQGATYRQRYGSVVDTSQSVRRRRLTQLEPLDGDWASHRRFAVPYYGAPQRWGYNVIQLYPEAGASQVTVTFRGVSQSRPDPDWRWGLVATDSSIARPRYSPLQKGGEGELTFCVQPGEPLFLVVMASPSSMQVILWDQAYGTIPRYPFLIQLKNAWPDGFQNGAQDLCPAGLVRVVNGGGCAPASLPASVYVGPFASVFAGTNVSGSARIEDHALVLRGTVTGGTVGALTTIDNFSVTGGIAKTTFYPLGFFESGQGISGGASLIGDVEYRGTGTNRTSGICTGFVDAATCLAPGTDSAPAPPYTWR